jgi:hypothetical protein
VCPGKVAQRRHSLAPHVSVGKAKVAESRVASATARSTRIPKKPQASNVPEACHLPTQMHDLYNELIFDKNSPFDFVLLSLSISNSIASTGDSGFSTFRSTQIRDKSSRGISNSSLRVPDR